MASTHTGIDFTRVFDILEYQWQKYPQEKAVNFNQNGVWRSFSVSEIRQKAHAVSAWLINQGFKKGDCIAILPRLGNPFWMMLDFGCQQVGVITVPLHPTASPEELQFILKEVKANICVAADMDLLLNVQPVFGNTHLYQLDPLQPHFFPGFEGVAAPIESTVAPTDALCILYTSGTSGKPKGAVLSHQNVVSNVKAILPLFPLRPKDKVLSFLPYSHVFERTASYAYLAFGVQLFFAEKLETVTRDFKWVQPVFCTCVPRTLERMYEVLEEKRQQHKGLEKILVTWAMKVGAQYMSAKKFDLLFSFKLLVARLLVLNRWRKALGGNIKYMVVGAAALHPQIGRLFSAAGVLTLSGYGMTEAAPFIAVNRPEPGMNRFGTVGLPAPGVEIKIEAPNDLGEGEILVRGPNIMQGYFNRPDLNAEVFTPDGWFRTGDVGHMVARRFLTITDRKKDIFKTSSGIYVAPQELESLLVSSTFISQAVVFGFNRPFVVAVMVPHFALLQSWCEQNSIHWTSPTYMVHNIKVHQKMQQVVHALNEGLPKYKRIHKFILTEAEWTVQSGELTPSLKVIRPKVLATYSKAIEGLYNV